MTTRSDIAAEVAGIIVDAGLNPSDYNIREVARLVERQIAESEFDFDPDGVLREFGISEADLWEGLGGEWDEEIPTSDAASDAAWAMSERFPEGTYGPLHWAAELEAAAYRNTSAEDLEDLKDLLVKPRPNITDLIAASDLAPSTTGAGVAARPDPAWSPSTETIANLTPAELAHGHGLR